MNQHDAAQRLLPWYVNGTLNEPDMAEVERHLETCQACRNSVEAEIQTGQLLHREDETSRLANLLENSDREFDRLLPQLHGPESARVRAARRRPAKLIPALAATVLVAAAIPTLLLLRPADPGLYELKTSDAAYAGPVLQLVFNPGTSDQDIKLLLSTSGTPISPPSEYGVYRIALTTDDPTALLARVRQHPAVRWAEIEL